MNGHRFERSIVTCYNTYFDSQLIDAIAYRFERASHYTVQPADILIDSKNPNFYLAVECKSFTSKGAGSKLYFSSAFSDATDIPQLDRMKRFLNRSGRAGLVAIEVKSERRLQAYILSFDLVYTFFKLAKGIPLQAIRDEGHHLTRENGAYTL